MNINTKEYWNDRFASGDWESKGGLEQTKGFMVGILANLPKVVIKYLNDEPRNIADVGCGIATGTALLGNTFKNCTVVGIDHAIEAIKINNQLFPELKFEEELTQNYDCIVSSNVLEHVDNPIEYLNFLSIFSSKYLIVLVPYKEQLSFDEHIHSFDSLPDKIYSFKKIDEKLVVCDGWMFEQLLTIYEKQIPILSTVKSKGRSKRN